jgi:hypothetical protein
VRFKGESSFAAMNSVHDRVGGARLKRFNSVKNLELVKIPPMMSVESALQAYRGNPEVLHAEPDYIVKALAIPDDLYFPSLWGFWNTGQEGGIPGADIKATNAWDITTGSEEVVVAVIDTGVDYNHEDLGANMWRNEADCNENGIDDDGNGYIDDCHGINVFVKNWPPLDDNSHGTHVSGIIGAVGNNSIGVVGVNWNVSIMACKFLNSDGEGYTSGATECLDYVKAMKDRGVNIVATNNSWGGGGLSQFLWEAIEAQREAGTLFIGAAGNSGNDNDVHPDFPASTVLPNVISVAATDRSDNLGVFSNDGRRSTHLGAPGVEILSTTIENTYSTFSGTSMAAPYVTGVAALLKAQDPSRDWRAIKNLILSGGETAPSLANTITGKRLDAYGALTCSNSVVRSRLWPRERAINARVGEPVDLSVLHINCAAPNGEVRVSVDPGGEIITLKDDGASPDQAPGDGIYSGQWTPPAEGIYGLIFPGGDTLSVRVLNGTPHMFRPAMVCTPGQSMDAVAIGDVNGDGRNDVVFAGRTYNPITQWHLGILLQGSSGALDSPIEYLVGSGLAYVRSIAVGDINNDGRADVVIVNTNDYHSEDGFMGIFLQNTSGGLEPIVKYFTPNSSVVRIADLNNDGLSDVARIGKDTDSVDIFFQHVSGTLNPPVTYPIQHSGIAMEIGDVNNDGLNDIIVGGRKDSSKPNVGILYQRPDGTFGQAVYYDLRGNHGTHGLAVGDVSADGLNDIIASYDMGGNEIAVFVQDLSGKMMSPVIYESEAFPHSVKIWDINGDGRSDLIVGQNGKVSVLLQAPNGAFFSRDDYAIDVCCYNSTEGMAVGDVNGDGFVDIVTGGIVVFYADPQAEKTTATLRVQTVPSEPDKPWRGHGTIVSYPPGINCGPGQLCEAIFEAGTHVLLRAIAAPDSVFDVWGWGDCSLDGKGNCTVIVVPPGATVAAFFHLKSVEVTAERYGRGTIVSDLGGINCGSDCEEIYPSSRNYLSFRAIPDPGFVFVDWGEDCFLIEGGDGRCWVDLYSPKTVRAYFGPVMWIFKSGSGSGTVVSNPAGIDCGAACAEGFARGSEVLLSAAPEPGSVFMGWSSYIENPDCTGTGLCRFTMDYDIVGVAATFERISYNVTVTKSGLGAGTVVSSLPGIDCGSACSAGFPYRTEVILTASPAPGSIFAGWIGGGCTGNGPCTIVMDQGPVSVTAAFDRISYALSVNKLGTGNGKVTSSPAGVDCGGDCTENYT